ncbi:MAG: hypothetical protein AAGD35_01175 [Actinomycetota bacterium]
MTARLEGPSKGRWLDSSLSWRSAIIAVAGITVVLTALGLLARLGVADYPVTVTVIDQRTTDDADGCALEIDFTVRNDSERALRLIAVELVGENDARQGILGALDRDETVERTYRRVVAECPTGEDSLLIRYGPSLSTVERTATVSLNATTG